MKLKLSILIGLVAAMLAGASLALAVESPAWTVSYGTQSYGPTTITCDSYCDYGGFPDHSYVAEWTAWADDYYPDATSFTLGDASYTNGWSTGGSYVKFWKTRLFDAQGYDAFFDYAFDGEMVNGVSASTQYNHNWDLSAGNNTFVDVYQYISNTTGSGDLTYIHEALFYAHD